MNLWKLYCEVLILRAKVAEAELRELQHRLRTIDAALTRSVSGYRT